MNELLEKLSSYNIFNYLLPGVLLGVYLEAFLGVSLQRGDVLLDLFLFYFVGLIVSRIGSFMVYPFLSFIRFIKFAPHRDYIQASRIDRKLDTLSTENNVYRTLAALALCMLVISVLHELLVPYPWIMHTAKYWVPAALFVLFSYAYRKQTMQIVTRIEQALETRD